MAVFFTHEERQALLSIEHLVGSASQSEVFQGTLTWLKSGAQPTNLRSALAKLKSKDALVPSTEADKKSLEAAEKAKSARRDEIMATAAAQAKVNKDVFPDRSDAAKATQVTPEQVEVAKKAQAEEAARKAAEAAAVAAAAEAEAAEKAKAAAKAKGAAAAAKEAAQEPPQQAPEPSAPEQDQAPESTQEPEQGSPPKSDSKQSKKGR